jgi:hypothetical protein
VTDGYGPRPHVEQAFGQLANAYLALFALVPKTQTQANGRVTGTPSPPVPARLDVLDCLALIESAVPRLVIRAHRLLGWGDRVFLLSQRTGDRCPMCGCLSLVANMDTGVVHCRQKDCRDEDGRRHVWPWDHWELLGDILEENRP